MKGFTLVEVLMVMLITVMLTGSLVANFSRTNVDLNQTRLLVQDAIREAQALALSGAVYAGEYRCGYGIHFEPQEYTIYAGPVAEDVDCSAIDTNYDTGDGDDAVRTGTISNTRISIGNAPDIFFAPPKPTTYIDNSSDSDSVDIVISRDKASCSSQETSAECRFINVSTSGLITSK